MAFNFYPFNRSKGLANDIKSNNSNRYSSYCNCKCQCTVGTYGIVTVDAKGRATAGKRQLVYSGTTDASGNYTVTFGTAFSTTPNVQAQYIGGTPLNGFTITRSTTGFTVNVFTRSTVSSLPIIGTLAATLVGTATNPVSGGTVDVLVTEN